MLEFCGGEVGDRLEIHFCSSCLSLPGQGCGCVPMGWGQPAATAVRGSCGAPVGRVTAASTGPGVELPKLALGLCC